MKLTLLVTCLFLCFTTLNAQDLQGEWTGVDSADVEEFHDNFAAMKLFFKPTADTQYKVYSYCRGKNEKGKDTIVVAKVKFEKISPDSIYLEETEVLKPKIVVGNCLIKLYLKIVKSGDEIMLEGNWVSAQENCNSSGRIRFKKAK